MQAPFQLCSGGEKRARKISFSVIFALTIFAGVASEVFKVESMLSSHVAIKKVIRLISPSTVLFLELKEKLKGCKVYSLFLCIFTIC